MTEQLEPPHPPSSGGTAVPYFLALAVLVAMAYGGWKWYQVQQFEASRAEATAAAMVGPPLNEFELTERSGEVFRSADMRGKVWVSTYFFSTCSGSCVRLNRNIQLMHNRPELKDVTWVSITCDPDTDTLEALRAYADGWEADPERWLFCRGDFDYTARVALGMKLFLGRKSHMDHAVVVDKWGNIRGWFDAGSKSECQRLRTMLVQLVKEESPPDNVVARTENEAST